MERCALVVGGYGAIGSEICRGLAQYGASIAIGGRDGGKAAGLAQELEAEDKQAVGLRGDIDVFALAGRGSARRDSAAVAKRSDRACDR